MRRNRGSSVLSGQGGFDGGDDVRRVGEDEVLHLALETPGGRVLLADHDDRDAAEGIVAGQGDGHGLALVREPRGIDEDEVWLEAGGLVVRDPLRVLTPAGAAPGPPRGAPPRTGLPPRPDGTTGE